MTGLAASTSTPTVRRRRAVSDRRAFAGWWFLTPFLIVFLISFVAPILYAVYLSVFRSQLIGGNAFVGLENYARALQDPQFWSGVGRVSLLLVLQVPLLLIIALAAALALDSGKLRGMAFFRISIFLPYAVPAVVATLIWGFMYGTNFGLVGNLNDIFSTSLPNPLAPSNVLGAIANILIWGNVGYNMLIFYAALRVIPTELYEAAAIDGAGQFRIITAIKLPAIRGALVIAAIFSIIGSFQLFNEPQILQPMAPNAIPTYFSPNLYSYNLAFSGGQQNYSATVAIIMGVATMVVAYAVQLRGMRKGN
ncbi:carbohydrate ABC transporter permease [Ruania zhangjianzhongii]|uniref:carbohydrate ABC transporter permease n=1 Tax=Ruania zhangjianzhongii TaxID=2603206 RepID=UPI0011C8667D|nr:sugar ABC transporter permease [Ruania zhangjianzhongii]